MPTLLPSFYNLSIELQLFSFLWSILLPNAQGRAVLAKFIIYDIATVSSFTATLTECPGRKTTVMKNWTSMTFIGYMSGKKQRKILTLTSKYDEPFSWDLCMLNHLKILLLWSSSSISHAPHNFLKCSWYCLVIWLRRTQKLKMTNTGK